ncbi:MAG: DUF3572 family protein [Alphaproteobacteria bacterium]|jgi:hypothetical protein|nr:DUF3572 family protein [Alphaproteobacteria bacterium]
MNDRISSERAEILALEALAWLAGRPDDIDRFLAVSGLTAADLRRAAGEPELLASVFDFLLTNEPLLLEFCESASISFQTVHAARRRLEA